MSAAQFAWASAENTALKKRTSEGNKLQASFETRWWDDLRTICDLYWGYCDSCVTHATWRRYGDTKADRIVRDK